MAGECSRDLPNGCHDITVLTFQNAVKDVATSYTVSIYLFQFEHMYALLFISLAIFIELYQKQCPFVYATSQSRYKSKRIQSVRFFAEKSKIGPLPVTQINPATIKTGFDPVLNTFDRDAVVAQANKAGLSVDTASAIGGTNIEGNDFLSTIKIPTHMSHDLRRRKAVLTPGRHVEQGVRHIPFLAIRSGCTLS